MKLSITLTSILFTACASSSPRPTSPSQTGEREQAMSNCPNAVRGASTWLSMLDDGVEMLITADDPGARQEISIRADKHVRMGAPAGQAPEHTGLHGGPGAIGYCPIIHDATMVTVRPLLNGVVVRVKALGPDGIKPLQDETRSRVAGLHAAR